jgi:hypothetical protein
MSQSDQPQAKRPWQAPEMIEVGGVLDVTEAIIENVNDGSKMAPATYKTHGRTDRDEVVDLDD